MSTRQICRSQVRKRHLYLLDQEENLRNSFQNLDLRVPISNLRVVGKFSGDITESNIKLHHVNYE